MGLSADSGFYKFDFTLKLEIPGIVLKIFQIYLELHFLTHLQQRRVYYV